MVVRLLTYRKHLHEQELKCGDIKIDEPRHLCFVELLGAGTMMYMGIYGIEFHLF